MFRSTLLFILTLFFSNGFSQSGKISIDLPDSIPFVIQSQQVSISDTVANDWEISLVPDQYDIQLVSLDSLRKKVDASLECAVDEHIGYQIMELSGDYVVVESFRTPWVVQPTDNDFHETNVRAPSENVMQTLDSLNKASMAPGCPNPATNVALKKMLVTLEEVYFERDRVSLIHDFLDVHELNCSQFNELIGHLEFEDHRLEAIKKYRKSLCNPQQIGSLESLFTLQANRDKFSMLIAD